LNDEHEEKKTVIVENNPFVLNEPQQEKYELIIVFDRKKKPALKRFSHRIGVIFSLLVLPRNMF
jgi:hypothetical protein